MNHMNTALLFTGQGARISQEVALLDQLREKKGVCPSPLQTYVAGLGSGALNVLAVNACFRTSHPLSWDQDYKGNLLKNLTNDQVYLKTHQAYWDTIALHQWLERLLRMMDARRLSNLSFKSHILAYLYDQDKTVWAGSESSKTGNTALVDMVMASMALPVIFPSLYVQGIGNAQTGLPDGRYGDGATKGLFKRFKKKLGKVIRENGHFDCLYVISPMRDQLLAPLDNYPLTACLPEERVQIESYLTNISMQGFVKFLKKLEKFNQTGALANTIYVCHPMLKKNFPLLEFGCQMEQYNAVTEWANLYPEELTVELGQFLKKFRSPS